MNLTEIGLGLGIATMMTLAGITIGNSAATAKMSQPIIENMNTLTNEQAARGYIKRYRGELLSSLPVGGKPIAIRFGAVDICDGIPDGPRDGLPSIQGAGFGNGPREWDTDAYGMHHVLLVRQPVQGELEALIVQSSGYSTTPSEIPTLQNISIPDGKLRSLVHRLGPNAGARYSGDDRVYGKGWQAIPADWASSGYEVLEGRAVIHISNQK